MFNQFQNAISDNQTPEAKNVAEQSAAPGFAKVEREIFRIFGHVLKATGFDATACEQEVQKIRLLEAIVAQHKSDIQKELGIPLDVGTHRVDLEAYAQNQGYLDDAGQMSRIEGEIRNNTIKGPKLVLSHVPAAQALATPSVESKEVAEFAQRSSGTPQESVVEKQVEPVVLNAQHSQKILELMETFRKKEFAKVKAGQDTEAAVLSRIKAYENLENKAKLQLKLAAQRVSGP